MRNHPVDFDLARLDDVEAICGLALSEDRVPGRKDDRSELLSEFDHFVVRSVTKKSCARNVLVHTFP